MLLFRANGKGQVRHEHTDNIIAYDRADSADRSERAEASRRWLSSQPRANLGVGVGLQRGETGDLPGLELGEHWHADTA